MTLPRAFLIDLDDTILDDSSYLVDCWRASCETFAPRLNGVDGEALYESIDRTRRWYWGDPERHRIGRLDMAKARREVVRLAFAGVGLGAGALADEIADHYGERRDREMAPIPGAIETVRWLRDQGCALAVVTNGAGDAQRAKLTRFGLEPLFDAIMIEGEFGFGKPDPRVYRRTLKRLGVGASEAWMVGDNLEWDVAAPQREGIAGIWIDRRGTGLPMNTNVRPLRILRSLKDLIPRVVGSPHPVR